MILGIESSCDDTSVALYNVGTKKIIASQTYNQAKSHAKFGGIVPEIASREHLSQLPGLISALWAESGSSFSDLKAIAVTSQPGLIGSLLIGVSYARALSYALKIPLLGVDHLEAHIFSAFLEQNPPVYPFLSLLISGGHTHLFLVEGFQKYVLLGRTLDDALGEAFDKVAKMLGLSYPGGPELEKIAKFPTDQECKFPIPLQGKPGMNFSFSGLKTFARNAILARMQKQPQALMTAEDLWDKLSTKDQKQTIAIAQGFQKSVFDFLLDRLEKASKITKCGKISICGGVAQNLFFQSRLQNLAQKLAWEIYTPHRQYIADNGSMVAFLASLYWEKDQSLFPNLFQARSISPLSLNACVG